jgi:quinol monooxygenase YgiN
MAYILVHTKVKDYRSWRSVFDELSGMRRAHGEKSFQVFQSAQNPNDLTILFEWESAEKAKQYMQSDELKKSRERAGAIGEPEVHVLNKS